MKNLSQLVIEIGREKWTEKKPFSKAKLLLRTGLIKTSQVYRNIKQYIAKCLQKGTSIMSDRFPYECIKSKLVRNIQTNNTPHPKSEVSAFCCHIIPMFKIHILQKILFIPVLR